MLRKLKKIKKIASPEDIRFLLEKILSTDISCETKSLRAFCISVKVDLLMAFDQTIEFLNILGILKGSKNDCVELLDLGVKEHLGSEASMSDYLVKTCINKLVEDHSFEEFIPVSAIKYDVKDNSIRIINSHISTDYSALRNFLLECRFFLLTPSNKSVISVNNRYSNYFETIIIPFLNEEYLKEKISKISPTHLKQLLEQQEEAGEEAELFVVEFEKRRLFKHPYVNRIRRISLLDVAAGYDIVSFEDVTSLTHDRFIEVKSYISNEKFFWSKNEMLASRAKGSNYYIYLVDRSKMRLPGYSPKIISDPYNSVFMNNDWTCDPQNWLVNSKTK